MQGCGPLAQVHWGSWKGLWGIPGGGGPWFGGGWRVYGRDSERCDCSRMIDVDYIRSAVDDCTRLGYGKAYPD